MRSPPIFQSCSRPSSTLLSTSRPLKTLGLDVPDKLLALADEVIDSRPRTAERVAGGAIALRRNESGCRPRKCRYVSPLDHGLVAATSSYVQRRSLHIAITVFSMSMR